MGLCMGKLNPKSKPKWTKKLHEISYDGVILHRFGRPAPVAELILDAFHEQNWVCRIDDPLRPIPGRKESERLRRQIEALNLRLNKPLIRFFMDGTGTGICWKPVKD